MFNPRINHITIIEVWDSSYMDPYDTAWKIGKALKEVPNVERLAGFGVREESRMGIFQELLVKIQGTFDVHISDGTVDGNTVGQVARFLSAGRAALVLIAFQDTDGRKYHYACEAWNAFGERFPIGVIQRGIEYAEEFAQEEERARQEA